MIKCSFGYKKFVIAKYDSSKIKFGRPVLFGIFVLDGMEVKVWLPNIFRPTPPDGETPGFAPCGRCGFDGWTPGFSVLVEDNCGNMHLTEVVQRFIISA
jgi:hypothetical protein